MPNPFFRFKQFTVYHDQCSMKVGTDGVLLGAWTDCSSAKRILDIGTGSGLIALMLAQRSDDAIIDAIDIDEAACKQAEFNFTRSSFFKRLRAYHTSIRDFHPAESYDLIVSNPPFFSASLKSPDSQRNLARHDDSLTLDLLFGRVRHLLNPKGRFCLILPIEQEQISELTAASNKLHPRRKTFVHPTPTSNIKRILWEYNFESGPCTEHEIVIETSRHHYSEEFIQLTKEYYYSL